MTANRLPVFWRRVGPVMQNGRKWLVGAGPMGGVLTLLAVSAAAPLRANSRFETGHAVPHVAQARVDFTIVIPPILSLLFLPEHEMAAPPDRFVVPATQRQAMPTAQDGSVLWAITNSGTIAAAQPARDGHQGAARHEVAGPMLYAAALP